MDSVRIQESFEIGFYILYEGDPYFSHSEPEICLNTEIEIVTPEEFILFYSLKSPIAIGSYLGEYDEIFWNMIKPVKIA